MEGTSRELLILYGSQTGTAEEIAERIGREGKRRHFLCRICAMDDFDLVIYAFFPLCWYPKFRPRFRTGLIFHVI